MVPSGLTAEDNKYYEYMVVEIDGIKTVERVGSWEVDLDKYILKTDANRVHQDINNELTALANELSNIDERAEANVINSVSSSFEVDANRELKLVSVPVNLNLSTNTSLLDSFV
jgi:tRNA A22 N-methylase